MIADSQQELRFEPGPHAYFIGEERLLSVTQVLEHNGLMDTTWFTEEARLRGEFVHLACQYDDEGTLNEDELDPALLPYVHGWRQFRFDYQFLPDLIEARVWHPEYRYAGTLDRTGPAQIRGREMRCLIDLKTGAAQPAYPLQLAGYAATLEDPASYVRLKVGLTPRPNGAGKHYNVFEYPVTTLGRDLNVFLSGLIVAQWKMKEGLWQQY